MYFIRIKDSDISFCYEQLSKTTQMVDELLEQCYEVEITTDEIMAMRKAKRGE